MKDWLIVAAVALAVPRRGRQTEAERETRRVRLCETKQCRVACWLSTSPSSPPVILAASSWFGMHTATLRELCAILRERREWSGHPPGDTSGGWSEYRIRFEDSTAYIGMTGRTVTHRLGQHRRGDGAAGVRQRRRAGVAYRFDVLASRLTEREARRIELAEIARLRQPLNMTGARPPGVVDLFDVEESSKPARRP